MEVTHLTFKNYIIVVTALIQSLTYNAIFSHLASLLCRLQIYEKKIMHIFKIMLCCNHLLLQDPPRYEETH